jgi:hypothetical protein
MGSIFSNVIADKQEKIAEAQQNIAYGYINQDATQIVQGFAGFLGQIPLPGTGIFGKVINFGGQLTYTVISATRNGA